MTMTRRAFVRAAGLAVGAAGVSAQSGAKDGGHYPDPLVLVAAIYRTYTADKQPPALPDVYSRRLAALIDADVKNTPEGHAPTLDWDLFVNGNNWEVTNLKIELVSQSGVRAQVRAQFDNFKKPQEITFDLV